MNRFYAVAVFAALSLAACDKPKEASARDVSAPVIAPMPAMYEAPAGTYTLDKAHASLIFRVSHLGFSHFTGRFTGFDATLTFDPKDPAAIKFEGTVDAKSLTLDNPPAGFVADLLGAQWLEADKYPTITFHTTKVEVTGAHTANVTGDFTLHGITKPLTLAVTYNGGYAGNPYDPNARAGFSARGVLLRGDYGLGYGIPAPGSNMGVANDVELILESEFNGPAWAGATPPAKAP